MSGSARVALLSGLTEQVVRASELTAGRVIPSPGWSELDALLPGGVPRGRITEWAGPRSAGKTTMLRGLVRAVLETGIGAAYVDGTGTLTPAPWIVGRLGPDGAPPFWVVRPPESAGVLTAAAELLRSGAFGLVIGEGVDWSRVPAIRLQRLAREANAALVAVVDRPGRVPLAGLRLAFDPGEDSAGGRGVRVRGRPGSGELVCSQELPYRLPEDAGLPDRAAASTR